MDETTTPEELTPTTTELVNTTNSDDLNVTTSIYHPNSTITDGDVEEELINFTTPLVNLWTSTIGHRNDPTFYTMVYIVIGTLLALMVLGGAVTLYFYCRFRQKKQALEKEEEGEEGGGDVGGSPGSVGSTGATSVNDTTIPATNATSSLGTSNSVLGPSASQALTAPPKI